MIVKYRFSDSEIKKLLDSMVIIVDTREQQNQHILDYFNKKKVNYETKKLDSGDYGIKLKAVPELNINRDIYIPVTIEKKNSVDELAQSFKERTRFENEFIRAQGNDTKVFLLIEDGQGYENIIKGNYRSKYEPKALLASLKTFESRYNISTSFIDRKFSGNFIYHTLKYYLYEYLKS